MNATNDNQPDADGDVKAPTKLVTALKQCRSERIFVPPSVDASLLHAARKHLARPEKPGLRIIRRWVFWPSLATACVCLALLAHTFANRGGRKFAREDLNHDGRVDILDAFALARQVKSGITPRGLDLNGDGVVDRRDAEAIAAHAVKLEKGGRS